MLYRNICKILGYYLLGLSFALLIPFFLALYYLFSSTPLENPLSKGAWGFFWSFFITLAAAFLCYFTGAKSSAHVYRREGLISVVLIWFLTPIFAGLPYYFTDTLKNPIHCYFEAASGFTTTGATCMQAKKYNQETGEEIPITKSVSGAHTTVYRYWGTIEPVRDAKSGKILYEGIEAVSKPLLFWRSLTQWFGGMGIVVLFVAVLPVLGVGGKALFRAEIPGPLKDSLTPRIKETALSLWKIYIVLSVLEVVLLMATNGEMGLFDALTITFSTVSTGGMTVKNSNIAGFHNIYTDWIVILFMLLGGINFSLYFYSFRGKFYRIYEPEFFLYLLIILFACSFSSWYLVGKEKVLANGEPAGLFNLEEAIRYGSFQIISGVTTTGFITANYDIWPYAVQTLLLILMFIGGMSGSTAGGMKVIRQYMLFRIGQYNVERLFCPESVRTFKIGEKEVDKGVSLTVLVYFLLVITIAAAATFFFIGDGIDPETSLSLSTLMINNTGIGFRMAAPTDSLAFLSNFSLLFSSVLMIFGRLEFLAVFALLVPAFWRQNK